MKSVVAISYYFPPDGYAGVYRPLRFIRHLQDWGWHATVIASELKNHGRYDPGLLSLVPENVEVVRVSGEDFWQRFQDWRARKSHPQPTKGLLKLGGEIHQNENFLFRSAFRNMISTCEGWYYHPDSAMPWIKPAVNATVQVCHRINPKAIWVTGGPWSAFVVAKKVSFQTGVPYILDFRDSWTLAGSPFYNDRPEWAKRRDRRQLFQLLQNAHAVTFRYQSEAECYWRAYPGALEPSRIHIIPNGFDGTIEEFDPVIYKQDKCVVLYAGTITPYRYDTLLHGLRLLKQSNSGLATNLHLLFVGEGTDVLVRAADRGDVSDVVKTKQPVSFAEVCRLQEKASALLLLGLVPVPGHELCGSKGFSYLKAGRPIVGIVPDDEMRKLLQRVGVQTIADIDSPSEIATVFRQLLQAWQGKNLSSLVPDRKACEAYSAEPQTEAMVRALEGAPPVEAFVPGMADIPQSLNGCIGGKGWL